MAAGCRCPKDIRCKPVKAPQLALQRLRFAPRLFAAAGYSGWCILIDEAELIGRYSVLQRGKSYAELCRWLGLAPDIGVPGVVAVCAITDDFKNVMFDEKLDPEKVPRVLEAKGLVPQARLAEVGMSAIEQRQKPHKATWRSGYAAVCKTAHPGSKFPCPWLLFRPHWYWRSVRR
jgi:hypothetical protein